MSNKNTLNKKRLTKQEVKDLLASGAVLDGVFTQAFEQTFPNGEVVQDQIYRLPEDKVLYVYAANSFATPGRGDIYNLDYFVKWMKQLKRSKENFDMNRWSSVEHWRYYSKVGAGLAGRVEELIDTLSEQINVPKKELDASYSSLDLVSQKINEKGLDELFEKFYDHLVAYVGEVIKERVKGHWEIAKEPCFGDYPFISIGLKNVSYMPINVVWSSLNEIQPSDLRKEAAKEVRALGMRAKFEKEFGERFRDGFKTP